MPKRDSFWRYPQRAASRRRRARRARGRRHTPSRPVARHVHDVLRHLRLRHPRRRLRARAVKAQRASAAAAFAPAAKASTAARLSLKPRANGAAALKATGSVAAKAARGSVRVLAGRFETERTYIMIKPDGVQRGYVRLPPVPSRVTRIAIADLFLSPRPTERHRPTPPPAELTADLPPPRPLLRLARSSGASRRRATCSRASRCSRPQGGCEEHYQDLSEKPFFGDLVDYICSGPVVCMVWEGPGVVKSARKMIGATNPLESEPGTIRGDLAVEVGRNVIHGSDSVESASARSPSGSAATTL